MLAYTAHAITRACVTRRRRKTTMTVNGPTLLPPSMEEGCLHRLGHGRGLRHTIVTCLVTCFVTCLVFHFLLHSDNSRYSSHVSALANTDPYSPLLTEVLPISTCNNIQPSHHITSHHEKSFHWTLTNEISGFLTNHILSYEC